MEAASIAHADHHGPPEANRSSRVEPQLLGMLLFIISEVMLFGAFFTAYFFIRVVNGDAWPAEGTELPVAVAGITLVLTFLTLVFGELAPKRLAMQRALPWALAVARPLDVLSTVSRPVVALLSASTPRRSVSTSSSSPR